MLNTLILFIVDDLIECKPKFIEVSKPDKSNYNYFCLVLILRDKFKFTLQMFINKYQNVLYLNNKCEIYVKMHIKNKLP